MSYTTRIKEEIASIDSTRSERIAELSGFIRNNATITRDKITMTTENKKTAERIKENLEIEFEIHIDIMTTENLNFNKNKLLMIIVSEKVDKILKDIGYYDLEGNILDTPPEYIVGANEEIRAYLRGVFLCTGSINDPKTSMYHMELLINNSNETIFVQKLLNIFDLNAKILAREKGYMIYIKEADKISDYIKLLEANNAVMYFENVRVYRDQKNKTNRLNNCEQANMDRIIQTATVQLEQINIIEKEMSVDLLDDKTKEALEYRKKYPEASLKELAEIITMETNKQITKSGLNHRFRKIKELSERIKENKTSI